MHLWRTATMATDKPTANELTVESPPRAQERIRPSREPLRLSVRSGAAPAYRADVLVVGVFADGTLPATAKAIDKAGKGAMSAVIQRGDLEEKPGSTLLLHDAPGTKADRLLLVNMGTRQNFGDRAFRSALNGASRALANGVARTAVVALTDVEVPGRPMTWLVRQATRLLADGAYRFEPSVATNGHLSKREHGARVIELLVAGKVTPDLEHAANTGLAIAEGMALAR